jgi:hypothetical protein
LKEILNENGKQSMSLTENIVSFSVHIILFHILLPGKRLRRNTHAGQEQERQNIPTILDQGRKTLQSEE